MSRQLRFGFQGGEVSDELWSRLDLSKYPTGVTLAENYIILPHGPAQNRAGLRHVIQAKHSDFLMRLVSFDGANVDDVNWVLEFGEQYIRFHALGGTLLEEEFTVTDGVQAPHCRIYIPGHNYVAGDWIYLDEFSTSISFRRWLEGRYVVVTDAIAGESIRIQDLRGNLIDSSAWHDWDGTARARRVYEIGSPYSDLELFDLHFAQKHDILTITHPNHPPRELRRNGPLDWTLSTITFGPTIATPAAPTVVALGPGGGAPVTFFYRVTALAEGNQEESLPSPAVSASRDLTLAGNKIRVTPAVVAGAARYNVYKLKNGLYGFIAQTEGGAVDDDNITPDFSKTLPFPTDPFQGTGNFPQAVTYFQGRRIFAGTINLPQNFWMTVSGTEKNLNYSIPTRDDDGIAGALGSNQVHAIRHALQLGNLVFLTNGGEWKFDPGSTGVLTPANAFPKQDSAEGAGNLTPVVSTGTIVYANEALTRLNKLEYSWQKSSYVVEDISVLAPHLFDDYQLVDMTYTKSPWKILWAVRNDGTVIGLTYHPEHEVSAWHRHVTAPTAGGPGLFMSACTVREGNRSVPYFAVRRYIGAQYWTYIEFMENRRQANRADYFFVDSGAPLAPFTEEEEG